MYERALNPRISADSKSELKQAIYSKFNLWKRHNLLTSVKTHKISVQSCIDLPIVQRDPPNCKVRLKQK